MHWTEREIAQLAELRRAGRSNQEIAQTLGRSVAAVGTKARSLKLPFRNYVPTPPPQPPGHRVRLHIPRAGKVTLPPLPSLA
jgi:hypothetical protein